MRAFSRLPNKTSMLLRSAQFLVVLLPLLPLGSCADDITTKSYNELISSHGETLTEDERKAAISDLQKEQRKKEQLKERDQR